MKNTKQLILVSLMFTMALLCQSCQMTPTYKNPNADIEDRVADLVSRMTVEEKISQMSHLAPAIERLDVIAYEPVADISFEDKERDDPLLADPNYKPWEDWENWPEGDCQDGGWWSEALHGVARSGLATVFPQAIGLGSTWNPDLIQQMNTAASDEARIYNQVYGKQLTYWSPTINMLRDPRWGRTEEAYSEDPYLMSRMAVAFVKGFQGEDEKYLKAVATVKHFVANNSEFNRHTGSSNVSERNLREYYLPAFQAAITEAGCFSVMGAYNALNGVPCCANPTLMTDILRGEWGFQGYVVSDCGAISDIVHGHEYETDPEKAVAIAVAAGTDLECETCETEQFLYDKYLPGAFEKGYIDEETLDKAVTRLFRARFRLGEFDPPEMVPYSDIPADRLDCQQHRDLALEVARQTLILLKNDEVLPLNRDSIDSVAVIGPNADEERFGGYSGTPSFAVTTLEGIKNMVGDDIEVNFALGCELDDDDTSGFSEAAEIAADSDVAVVVVGTSLEISNEALDRSDLDLPGVQEELIKAVYEANPKTIVILINGMPLSINWTQENVPAIIEAWYPGQSGGTAIAEALFGKYNPGGKLPVTFFKSVDQLPPLEDYDITKGRTYWYFDGEPLYHFGHGLSYTTFEYSNLVTSSNTFDVFEDEPLAVTVTVENSGEHGGDEVVQLYIKDPERTFDMPKKKLRAFKRVHIPADEQTNVTFILSKDDFAFWHPDADSWAVETGDFEIQIGSSSEDIRLTTTITIPE
jgi:beta-glucosidase